MRQREPRLHDPGFLRFLRTKPCCICGAPAEAAHIRIGLFAGAMKPHDKHATPLCPRHHRDGPESQHAFGNEAEWWKRHDKDPFVIAARLYAEYGGTGGKPRKRRTTIRPRLPKEKRVKIPSRPFPKRRDK